MMPAVRVCHVQQACHDNIQCCAMLLMQYAVARRFASCHQHRGSRESAGTGVILFTLGRRRMVNVRSTGVWSKFETALCAFSTSVQQSNRGSCSNGVCWRAYTSGHSCRGLWGPAPAVVAPALGICVIPRLCS